MLFSSISYLKSCDLHAVRVLQSRTIIARCERHAQFEAGIVWIWGGHVWVGIFHIKQKLRLIVSESSTSHRR
jgi:hypothetical protein